VRDKKPQLIALVLLWCFGQAFWGYFAHNFEHHMANYIMQIQLANYLFFCINLGGLLYTVKF
jgi:hypothetical protein